MRRTKIVCTIGPACDSPEKMEQMILAGMNVARLNFSHGTHEEHFARLTLIRSTAEKLGVQVAIMLDTKGPEIRTGVFPQGLMNLKNGDEVILSHQGVCGENRRITVTYEHIAEDVKPGDSVLLDDGKISLQVVQVNGEDVICRVIVGGDLKDHKGVNIPGVSVKLPALTEKDIDDLRFGVENGVDFIAASFVRKADDVINIRRIIEEGRGHAAIIAKIEHADAVKNLDMIIEVADGVMVARGDLGVEMPTEEVPILQKHIIAACNKAGKPVITATQMLESMIGNPRPTRAEANDVANAIFDGTDATMLSGESAAGKYPVEAVTVMAKIADRADRECDEKGQINLPIDRTSRMTAADAISHAACQGAHDLYAAAIITPTESGSTARMVAKYRPSMPVVAPSPNPVTCRQLSLVKGVFPIHVQRSNDTDTLIAEAVKAALSVELIKPGDMTIITAGVPFGVPGTTNLLKVHVAAEALTKGVGIGDHSAVGPVHLIRSESDLAAMTAGDIAVVFGVEAWNVDSLKLAAGMIAVESGMTSSSAIAALHFRMPAIVGVPDAFDLLTEGCVVTIDATRGIVYMGSAHVN